jgi:hypothetical protein
MERSTRHGTLAAALLAALLLFPSPASAGWVIDVVDPDFPTETTTYYFQDDKARVEGLIAGLAFIIDLASGEGYIIDVKAGRYAGGEIGQVEEALREERLKGDAGEPEETTEDAGGEREAVFPLVLLERSLDAEKVAGFDSEHYRVLLEEELVEELWLSPAVGALKEGRAAAFFSFLERMTGGSPAETADFPPGYDEHPDYLELLRTGFPLRRTLYFVGEKNIVEVTKAAEKALPEGLFTLPAGMEESDYPALFLGRR